MDIIEWVFLWYDGVSFGYVIRSDIAGSWGWSIACFVTNHHIDFYCGHISLQYHWKALRYHTWKRKRRNGWTMNSRNIQGNASIHKDDLKGKNKKGNKWWIKHPQYKACPIPEKGVYKSPFLLFYAFPYVLFKIELIV